MEWRAGSRVGRGEVRVEGVVDVSVGGAEVVEGGHGAGAHGGVEVDERVVGAGALGGLDVLVEVAPDFKERSGGKLE